MVCAIGHSVWAHAGQYQFIFRIQLILRTRIKKYVKVTCNKFHNETFNCISEHNGKAPNTSFKNYVYMVRISVGLPFKHWYHITHSWIWALLEKPPIVQLLKNFPAFYGTRRFITVFTRALHWSLSWARSIQSPPPHPISLSSILILFTHLRHGLGAV
jgi:hypothetical protein